MWKIFSAILLWIAAVQCLPRRGFVTSEDFGFVGYRNAVNNNHRAHYPRQGYGGSYAQPYGGFPGHYSGGGFLGKK
ncbi:CLUMA_CG021550, isoform A [Clunio marinus]|uniref:CLUMA_CG021550, isoform A n=1 Tax=Clunio marinus TaxID=568069 RepID=A0A1J1J7I3_9DIPT|nr:CLUMA_CG021550, isoform A [Clunio marinus]